MANDSYTFIVVPHAKARFRKFQVSVRFAKWVFGASMLGLLLSVGVLIHYTRIAFEVRELRQLRSENVLLRTRTQEYEQNAGRLQERLQTLQKMVTKLGMMAGLEQSLPDSSIGGVGGVTGPEAVAPSAELGLSLRSMESAVSSLSERSVQLEEFYKDQTVMLASTPSVWPVRGYLSAGFGNRIDPFTGLRDFHSGIDISTPSGTRVQAPADGVVISCKPKSGAYGNAIVIDHGYGVVTRYGHLDAFNVKPGQRVKRGDVIAFVGNTGRSTAPHLHYEVWVRDQAQNPIHFILDEYRSFG
jgi:murein DD-endopeptidase MepM/ murein hydrolase activator NlpD